MNNKKAATKEKIMKAAIKLIALNGFNATTTASIAKEAGISDTIIFKYFRDKQTLLREIVQQAMGELLDNIEITPLIDRVELSKDYPAKDFLKSILMDRFEFMENNFELVKIVLMEMQYSEELMVLVEKKLFGKMDEVIGIVVRVLAVKMEISDEKAAMTLRIGFGTLLTFILQKHFLGLQINQASVEREIDHLLDILIFSKPNMASLV